MEAAHSTIRIMEEKHGLKVKSNLGSVMHAQKALKSHVWYNSRRAGFIPSDKFLIRTSKNVISNINQ